jgi:outer membrane protein assembly factor BamB
MQNTGINENEGPNRLNRRILTASLTGVFVVLVALVPLSMAREMTDFDWPQFHGPNRDNTSRETGLLKKWPPEGPQLLWTAEGVGEGFSTVAIAEGLVYTTGNIGDYTVITALTADGSHKWTAKNGPAYKRDKPGTRSTPTIDSGRLYHENADGDVVCLDAKTGEEIWSLNILERFNGRNITWALSESLLIDGNRLICTPGGENAGIVALEKNTGTTIWVCDNVHDKPGYASPVVFEFEGLRQIVTLMATSVVGVNADTGRLLWKVKHSTPFDENINTPVYHDGSVFISSRTTGSRRFRLRIDKDRASVEQVWESTLLDPQHGGILLLDGYLYGACRSASSGPWVCLNARTGARMYAERGIGTGSLTYADGLLYALNHKRTVALVRPSPRAFDIISQFDIPNGGRGPTWAHPVVSNGRLYVRHGDYLYCHDVAEAQE